MEGRMKRLDDIDAPEAIPGAAAPIAQPNGFNEEELFTTTSGGKYKTWEEINTAINKPAEIIKETVAPTFANDASKQVFDLLVEGKVEETLPILQQRSFATKVQGMQDDDVIVAQLRNKYPSLTDVAARRHLEKTYAVDSNLDGVDLEIATAMATDKKKIDAQDARKYFADSVQELQFPKLTSANQPEPVMSDAAKQAQQFGQDFQKSDTSNFVFEFAPDNSTLKVKGQISPDAAKIKAISEQIGDSPEGFLAGFIGKNWMKEGKFDKDAMARDLAFLADAPNMFNSVTKKTANDVLGQKIASDKNIAGATGNELGNATPAEVGGNLSDPWEKFFHIPPERKTA